MQTKELKVRVPVGWQLAKRQNTRIKSRPHHDGKGTGNVSKSNVNNAYRWLEIRRVNNENEADENDEEEDDDVEDEKKKEDEEEEEEENEEEEEGITRRDLGSRPTHTRARGTRVTQTAASESFCGRVVVAVVVAAVVVVVREQQTNNVTNPYNVLSISRVFFFLFYSACLNDENK
ncbi:hypothetical protein V1477_005910 [Vespula maculifrons]|uniref:Uncharacterized protein n=1 Tax=Vespula maculifrons TaxID=7453 RepID=A0ABD2CLL5_VESMC